MQKSELTCLGRCDGMGDLDSHGSYVRINYSQIASDTVHGIVISEGEAETLIYELAGALEQKDNAAVAEIMRNVRGV